MLIFLQDAATQCHFLPDALYQPREDARTGDTDYGRDEGWREDDIVAVEFQLGQG